MTADVIVVGAGSAGCVVAARVAERLADAGGGRVLLLEAGPDGIGPASVGTNFLAAVAQPDRVWTDLAATRVRGGPSTPYLRGRGLGGTAAINALVGTWGTRDDDAAWAAVGGPPWSAASLDRLRARVGRRLPRWLPPRATWSPFERRLADAARAAGYPWCADPDVAGAWGVGPAPLTVRDGRRWSVVDAYLDPLRRAGFGGRTVLHVEAGVTVASLLVEGRRVVGVRTTDGRDLAARGVVVACGAIHSPALLLRSGIQRPGIGANLADHASAGFAVALAPDARLPDTAARPLSSLIRYSSGLAGAGPLDMQLLPLGATAATPAGLEVASLQVAVMAPFSRGRVTLSGPDPADPPHVELDLLADRRDVVRLRDGLARARDLLGHPAMSGAVAGAYVDDRGTPVESLGTEHALEAWLAASVGRFVHATGTCRLGRPDDPDAVVDPQGGLIGYEAVWVADASVLPVPPRAGTHLSAVLVGEAVAPRVADAVLAARRG